MEKVNIRELHLHTGKVVDAAAKGDVILIERRGTVVAELRPATPRGKKLPDSHWEWIKQFPIIPGDITDCISEDRDE